MINRRMVERVLAGELDSNFLKFVHTTDGTRAKYINVAYYKTIEFSGGDLILTDESERVIIIQGTEWVSKEMN